MKLQEYIVALDQGTSSCRAILVDHHGQQVAMAQQEFTQILPQPGWVEHNPEEIWETQIKVLDSLLDEAKVDASQIRSIGITNQRETTVVWDKYTSKPVYNAIVWQDKRTANYCKELKAKGLETYTKENMGLPIDPYFSGTKVNWILHKTGAKDAVFGTIDSWLIWKMTGGKCHKTDFTNASRTLLYNIKTKAWDDHMLEALDIPLDMLPQVQDSASDFGTFHYRGQAIPITGVAGDQQAAMVGQACFESGMAKNTYGTGCFMLLNVGKKYVKSEHVLLTTLCCDQYGKSCYALEGSIFMAGASIQWLRDGLQIISNSAESEQLTLEVIDSHEVVVVPSFAGLGAPYWSMDSKGAMYGLTRDSTKAHIAKATLDAIAFRTKDVLDAMEKDGNIELKVLKVDGGACKNNYLMQFQSDVLDATIERPQNVETTAMGAAYLAGLATGFFDSGIDTKSIDKTFNPEIASEHRDKIYSRWQRAVKATINF